MVGLHLIKTLGPTISLKEKEIVSSFPEYFWNGSMKSYRDPLLSETTITGKNCKKYPFKVSGMCG